MDHYEQLVTAQTEQLRRMRGTSLTGLDDEADEEVVAGGGSNPTRADSTSMTEDEVRREEEVIAELERKKRNLEDRVNGIEKDLGGLMR